MQFHALPIAAKWLLQLQGPYGWRPATSPGAGVVRRMLRTATAGSDARHHMALFCFFGGLLDLLYWILYFTGTTAGGAAHAEVALFESAFPVADGIFALVLVVAGIGLLRARPYGVFALIIAGSAALYLGILDITFYAGQGLYRPLGAPAAFQLLINAVTVGGGFLAMRYGWKFWREPWAARAG